MASETIKRIVGFVDFFSDDTRNGYKIPQSEYAANGRNLIIDQGDNEIAGYSDRDEGLYTSVPAVVFGDHTRIIKYVDKPFFIGADGVKILKPQRGVDPKYAYYALKAARIESLGYSRHFKVVKELHFVLPDDVVQKRIAAALDKISEMKRNAEARLQKLDLLVKARFNEMFGDVGTTCKLSEQTEVITKGTTPTSLGYEFQDEGVNFVKVETFSENGRLIPTKVAHISSECHSALKRSQLCENDVLFSIAGAIGRVAIVDKGILPANTNQALAIIRLKSDAQITAAFLVAALKSSMVIRQYLCMKQGVAQLNLSLKNVSDFVIPLPPLSLQRSFAAFVEKVEALKATAQASLARVDFLYRAKLQEYFG